MKTDSLKTLLFAIAALCIMAPAGVAAAEDLSAAKLCVVQTKSMQSDFLTLSYYLKRPDAQRDKSFELLGAARASLQRAEGACATIPEMNSDFLELQADLNAIEAAL